MQWKSMLIVFGTIFLAELGDKTQLAIFCLSTVRKSKPAVFIGACLALILTSALAVLAGTFISKHVTELKYVHRAAGVLFIIVGVLMLTGRFST